MELGGEGWGGGGGGGDLQPHIWYENSFRLHALRSYFHWRGEIPGCSYLRMTPRAGTRIVVALEFALECFVTVNLLQWPEISIVGGN